MPASPSPPVPGRVLAVSRLHAVTGTGRPGDLTGIDKRPVDGSVVVRTLGVDGDRQLDRRHHGGPDKAVYAYASEDMTTWSALLGHDLAPGLFGENLTTAGLDVTGAVLGERWQVGDAGSGPLLEVTMPRTPCYKFAHRMGEPHWVKQFTAHGAPGAYLRVLREGEVQAGAAIAVVHRPDHSVTIGEMFSGPTPRSARLLLAAGDARELSLPWQVRTRAERVVSEDDREPGLW